MCSEPRDVPGCEWCDGLLAKTVHTYRRHMFCCEQHRERWLTQNRRMPIQWQRWVPEALILQEAG